MVAFTSIQDRDAYRVIRGYVYQVDLTIERWLGLPPHQILELECGEDIDTVSAALESKDENRLQEQVKHRETPLTLRSEEALQALAYAIHSRQFNPGLSLAFRYTTNIGIACERPAVFDQRVPAIQAWESIRKGELEQLEQEKAVNALLGFLRAATKPVAISAQIWNTFIGFLNSASASEMLSFIGSFEWSTGTTPSEGMQAKILLLLTDTARAADARDAQAKYERLFLYVFKLLCQKGTKRLTSQELQDQLALPVLTQDDQITLLCVRDILRQLDARLSIVEKISQDNSKSVATLQAAVKKLGDSQEEAAIVAYGTAEPVIDIPPQVQHLSRRRLAVADVVEGLASHTWIAMTGTIGSGKTQLAILVAQEVRVCRAWIHLRDKEAFTCSYLDKCMDLIAGRSIGTAGRTRYQMAIQALSNGDLIVVDDVPALEPNRDLSDRLLFLLEACDSHGVRVLSTGTVPPESSFVACAGDKLRILPVPPFKEPEIADVLRAHGATSEQAKEWSSSVSALSYGHPVLVTAIARYLRDLGWTLSSFEQFQSLFVDNAYATEINKSTTRRLVETIEDADSRELLYRLNLATFGFDLEDVRRVASVRPPISHPSEKLSILDGLWVQRGSDGTYAVSPLVRRLGHGDLPAPRQQAICYLLGTRILSRRRIDLWDVSHVVAYMVGANAFQNALVVLSQGLHVLSERETITDDATLGLLWKETPLPPNVDLALRIFVRTLQINVNTKLGRDVTFSVTDIGNLIESAQVTNAWSVQFAAMELARHSQLYAQHWRLINNIIERAIRLFPEAVLPDGTKLASIVPVDPSSLLWLVVPNISTTDQLSGWAHLLKNLPKEAVRRAFSIAEVDDFCIEISHRVWPQEAEKPPGSRQWERVLDCFEELATNARALGLDLLWACTTRAKMIIYTEYCDDFDRAKALAMETITLHADSPKIQGLMREYIGHQYYYRREYSSARPWLEKARADGTEVYPLGRLRSLVYLGAIIGDESPARAQQLTEEAVRLSRTHSEMPNLYLAKALSELAISTWLFTNDVSAAFASFDEAFDCLLQCREDTIFWKAQFQRLGHVATYFDAIARGETLPAVEGEPYAAPFRGMFFRGMEQELADRFKEQRVWLIMRQVSSFASSVRADERAAYWACRAYDAARSVGQSHGVAFLADMLVPPLLQANKYGQVLDLALESSYAGTAASKLLRGGTYSIEASLDIGAVLGQRPNALWAQAERESAPLGLLPMTFRVLSVALADAKAAGEDASEISSICRQIADTASDSAFWLAASELFSSAFSANVRAEDLIRKASDARRNGYDVLGAMSYMLTSLVPGYGVHRKLYAQIMAMPYVHSMLKMLPSIYRQIVLSFIQNYWVRCVQDQRFLFSNPSVVEQRLKEADRFPEAFRAQYVLREMMAGLSVRIPKKDLSSWLYETPPRG